MAAFTISERFKTIHDSKVLGANMVPWQRCIAMQSASITTTTAATTTELCGNVHRPLRRAGLTVSHPTSPQSC